MNLRLVTKTNLTNNEKTKINDLIDYNDGIVFQETILNEVVSSVFKTKLNHYLVYDSDELIAYCAGHLKNHGILTTIELKPLYDIPYGGFIRKNDKYSVQNLISVLPQKKTYKYIYSSEPVIKDRESNDIYSNFIRRETAIVDLSFSEDKLWESVIHSKRRNMIRKARKEGITAITYNNEEGLKLFWPLMNNLHVYLGHHHLSYIYYERILNEYFKDNKAAVILAKKDGKVIAGVIVIGNKFMMHYWKGASKEGVKNEGQGDILQWEAIQYAKETGSKYYDLCVVDFENLAQIAKFKMGFAKIITPFYTKSYSSVLYKMVNRIQNVF